MPKAMLRDGKTWITPGLKNLLEEIKDPRRDALLSIYKEYHELFHYAAGSSHNHQAWKGGYADHIAECIRVNVATYKALDMIRPLPFTEDQATICLFFHDIEKPFRYGPEDHPNVQQWHDWHRRWMEGGDGEQDETRAGWEAAKWEIIRNFQSGKKRMF